MTSTSTSNDPVRSAEDSAARPFERLHPSLQHHIVNTLGWRTLRPLQQATVEPVLAGEHALLLAPTAGGKTEAASFPVLTRVASERWQPLSTLYLAPLRALLNNLEPRIRQYASFTGNRAEVWHGDVGRSDRDRILSEPPDLLLTTPESLEAMLISTRIRPSALFRELRLVVVDELHAFASDDRGWHMMAVLERLKRLAGRELQRIGLSATVGNPDELLAWFTRGAAGGSRVIAPPAAELAGEVDVQVDWVGSLANAAEVISQLHVGEKRLVFVDSRARAETLTAELRGLGVTTFLSHSSLSRSERQRTEEAFAQAQNCAIVATSTLELGVDIGDLDRVIQIDSPTTVASFLQRLGRTGRRSGALRNTLFLCTREDAFVQALALCRLWSQGYVEPVEPPPFPAHLLAQQIMALTLQEEKLGRSAWREWLGGPHVFGSDVEAVGEEIVAHMLEAGILFEDQGLLNFGVEGEATFGRRHFMELTSAFTSEPVFAVRSGRSEIGHVPYVALSAADANEGRLLLAGRHWRVESVDWTRRVIDVVPTASGGRIQFWGTAQPLSYEMCQSAKEVLAGGNPGVRLSRRAEAQLHAICSEYRWVVGSRASVLATDPRANSARWYTFAGLRANLELGARLGTIRLDGGTVDNMTVGIDRPSRVDDVLAEAHKSDPNEQKFVADNRSIEGLKFSEALPISIARDVVRLRFADVAALASVLSAGVKTVRLQQSQPD